MVRHSFVLVVVFLDALGDQVSHKGALTGGYYDSRASKLELQRVIKELKVKLEQQEEECSSYKNQLDDILYI